MTRDACSVSDMMGEVYRKCQRLRTRIYPMVGTRTILLSLTCILSLLSAAASGDEVDLSPVTEKHQMIPMRDGKHLSAYLYFPPGSGPWPVVFEQRYASIRGEGTRRSAARLAAEGFVVAMVNYRGAGESEGTWVGYRALAWGELRDGYDVCEWLGTQSWSNGKVGTFGSSQAGYAQNFLAITQPPHLTCQYMVDTGLSLFRKATELAGRRDPRDSNRWPRFVATRRITIG